MEIEAAFEAMIAIIGATHTPGGNSAQDDVLDGIKDFIEEQRDLLIAADDI